MLARVSYASEIVYFFFFNDTATTEIYTLSLHDALPISMRWIATARIFFASRSAPFFACSVNSRPSAAASLRASSSRRSEEHTSELQSQSNLVCRLLLEKKKIELNHTRPPHLQSTPRHAL